MLHPVYLYGPSTPLFTIPDLQFKMCLVQLVTPILSSYVIHPAPICATSTTFDFFLRSSFRMWLLKVNRWWYGFYLSLRSCTLHIGYPAYASSWLFLYHLQTKVFKSAIRVISIWSPRSSDVIPLDFFHCGYLEEDSIRIIDNGTF